MARQIGVLLVNLGTPLSPHPRDVRRYLIEFLTDGRVINLPWLQRQLIVRGLIVPKRYRSSAQAYQTLWTNEGSPLLIYGQKVVEKLRQKQGDSFHIVLGMRYQQPSIAEAMKQLEKLHLQQLIVLPLFPQYASATTGSVHEEVMRCLRYWQVIPELSLISSYPTHPLMIQAFAENARYFDIDTYDHVLFSFHGLPHQQIKNADKSNTCLKTTDCCRCLSMKNADCYSAQCFATAQALQTRLKLPSHKVSICYQSRLGKEPWLQPYASEHLVELVKKGMKKILVFSPAFVADCLETIYEVKEEYTKEFIAAGGKQLDLVPSLNDHPLWIEALVEMINSKIKTV